MKLILQGECAPSLVALDHGAGLLHKGIQVNTPLLGDIFSHRPELVLVAAEDLHGLLCLRRALKILLNKLHWAHAAASCLRYPRHRIILRAVLLRPCGGAADSVHHRIRCQG